MLSAHADADEILTWLKRFVHSPQMTFVSHSEPAASDALRKRIEEELGGYAISRNILRDWSWHERSKRLIGLSFRQCSSATRSPYQNPYASYRLDTCHACSWASLSCFQTVWI